MYTGVIEGVGPRYCPSIEDKIHRFADKDSAIRFSWNRKALQTHESLSQRHFHQPAVRRQHALVRSIRGLEHAHITRPGYAIEYDFFDPRDLDYSLETRAIPQVCSSPGRSTAPPVTKKPPRRACWPGLNAGLRARRNAWWPTPMKPISACWSMT
jgi:tRNA uridine 5-carboxymethylaminomethyl modification enzyme